MTTGFDNTAREVQSKPRRPSQRLLPVQSEGDLLPAYRDTSIADLFSYHNLGARHRRYSDAELLVGMCMDHRKQLRIPENFAYVIRAAGANLRGLEFQVSFAVAVGVEAIALIGHNRCGMSGLHGRRDAFVSGLVSSGGWNRRIAEQHFEEFAPYFEIGEESAFILGQACHLRRQYPKLTVAPLFYQLDDGLLYMINEGDGHQPALI